STQLALVHGYRAGARFLAGSWRLIGRVGFGWRHRYRGARLARSRRLPCRLEGSLALGHEVSLFGRDADPTFLKLPRNSNHLVPVLHKVRVLLLRSLDLCLSLEQFLALRKLLHPRCDPRLDLLDNPIDELLGAHLREV